MTTLADKTTRLDGYDILVVSPTPTWPLDFGNRKRIYEVCNRFKQRGARIHFVHYASEGDWRDAHPREATLRMQEQWDYNYTIAPSIDLHNEAQGEDHTIDEWWDPVLDSQLRWLFSAHSFDAVIVNYTWLSRALDFAPEKTYKILDTHDRFSGRGDLLLSNAIAKEFFHTTIAEEVKGLKRADLVWAIKAEEEAFFRTVLPEDSSTQVRTLLHGEFPVEAALRRQPPDDGCLTVGLIGGRNNINMVNTRNFLDTALPLFEQYMAPIKLLLAGSMCDDLHDIEHPHVELMGRVETVDEFYAAVDMVVVPMTFSTGLKIKVAEAFSYDVPIIGHKHAFEGYPVKHGLHRLESLGSVALACIDVAFDSAILSQLTLAGRDANLKILHSIAKEIEHTTQDVALNIPTAIYVLPELYFSPNSVEFFHANAIIEFLSWTYKALIYIPDDVKIIDRIKLLSLSQRYSVYSQAEFLDNPLVVSGASVSDILECNDVRVVWSKYDRGEYEGSYRPFLIADSCFTSSPGAARYPSFDIDVVSNRALSFSDESKYYFAPFGHIDTSAFSGLFTSFGMESDKVLVLFSGDVTQFRFLDSLLNVIIGDLFSLHWCASFDTARPPVDKNCISLEEFSQDYRAINHHFRCVLSANLNGSSLAETVSMLFQSIGTHVFDVSDFSGRDLNSSVAQIWTSVLAATDGSTELLDSYQSSFYDTWSAIGKKISDDTSKKSLGF